MQVLAVTHGPLVGPELFGDVVVAEGHELAEWQIERQGRPPQTGYDAVLLFGGQQNVGEEVEHPWLHDEYDAMRAWVNDGTPLFAVCLGAQTLAHALGGSVTKIAPSQLGGFYATELTAEGMADPVLGVLPRRFEALNANAYEFTVPAGGRHPRDGALRTGLPCGRPRLGGAVPPRGAARSSPGLVRGRRA